MKKFFKSLLAVIFMVTIVGAGAFVSYDTYHEHHDLARIAGNKIVSESINPEKTWAFYTLGVVAELSNNDKLHFYFNSDLTKPNQNNIELMHEAEKKWYKTHPEYIGHETHVDSENIICEVHRI
jgi:hypothetical protein